MNTREVTIVRIYTLEGETSVTQIMHYLQTEAHIRGVSVFRAVSGFGESGSHTASFMDISISLPLVIEFFDEPEKITAALVDLAPFVKSEHIVLIKAQSMI